MRATATIRSVRMETSLAFPICSDSAAWRTWERIPEYSMSSVCSSTPSGTLGSTVSMGMPSKPITLAAKAPSTRPQIPSRSSRNDIAPSLLAAGSGPTPLLLDAREQGLEERDRSRRRRAQLAQPPRREPRRHGVFAALQSAEDLSCPPHQARPQVHLG